LVRYIAESDEESLTIQEPSPKAYLTLLAGGRMSHSFPLHGEVTVGREKSNAVVVADQKVSRHHAGLAPIDNTFIITDLGSANGTYVNGVCIAQPTRLKDKDRISVGDTSFVFTTREPEAGMIEQPVSPIPVAKPIQPADPGFSSRVADANISIWALVGCMALVIVALLFLLAVLVGMFMGRTQMLGLAMMALAQAGGGF